jgi:hypothetical protein
MRSIGGSSTNVIDADKAKKKHQMAIGWKSNLKKWKICITNPSVKCVDFCHFLPIDWGQVEILDW